MDHIKTTMGWIGAIQLESCNNICKVIPKVQHGAHVKAELMHLADKSTKATAQYYKITVNGCYTLVTIV